MNSYIDYSIIGSIKITPLEVGDFPMDKFLSKFDRKTNVEADPFLNTPLFTRKSISREVQDMDNEKIWHDLYALAIIMIELLKENKQTGEMILYYKYNIVHSDFEIICSAFKFPSVDYISPAIDVEVQEYSREKP